MFWRDSVSTVRLFLDALSDENFESAIAMCSRDVVYIDSLGQSLEGRQNCADYLNAMAETGIGLRIHPEKMSRFGKEVLVSGHSTANDERFNARYQWRIATRRGKITRYQTFRGAGAVSMITTMKTYDPSLPVPA